jgi:hypothetical protein
MKLARGVLILTVVLAFVLAGQPGLADELELTYGGKIQSDLRFRAQTKSTGSYYNFLELPTGVQRNENILTLKAEALYGDYIGVIDVDFVWLGIPETLEGIGDLSRMESVSPYYLQTHALYLEAVDFLVEGLDLRVGQQKILWGVGDQFNPTNNLNASDLEDVLMFGEQMANMMVRADYAIWDMWTLSGALVPVFKPALLPGSSVLGLAAVDRMPIIESNLRYKLAVEKAIAYGFDSASAAGAGNPTMVDQVTPLLPERSLDNMPFSFRLAGTLLNQDVAFSYYRGRSDMPQPIKNISYQDTTSICNPLDEADCIEGLIKTDVFLDYPKMQVLGFNMSGEIPLTWIADSWNGIGYRLEVGIYIPEKTDIILTQDGDISFGTLGMPAGEYDYGLGEVTDGEGNVIGPIRPVVVEDQPFAKWVLGLDYTFGRHLMVNLMWVHGMPDEFGAGDFLHEGMVVRQGGVNADFDTLFTCYATEMLLGTGNCGARYTQEVLRPRLGDYAVLGIDFKFDEDKGLLRLFAILDVSGYFDEYWDESADARVRKYKPLFGDGFSAIIFPEFNYNFKNGLELGMGALLQLGKDFTKFGDPAAGGSLVWTRARFSF